MGKGKMKLKELMDNVFNDGPVKPYDTMSFGMGNYTLYGEKELLEYMLDNLSKNELNIITCQENGNTFFKSN